jgi:hypothetical protein
MKTMCLRLGQKKNVHVTRGPGAVEKEVGKEQARAARKQGRGGWDSTVARVAQIFWRRS